MDMIYRRILLCLWLGLGSSLAEDLVFRIPTPNRALFDGTEEGNKAFFAPTTSGIWQSGRYGCTRTAGWQFHEGIDILWTQKDRKGEPSDPVFATADGVICYINDKPGLSNYGRYLIIGHRIEGIELYSLYAHLSAIDSEVSLGRKVLAGAPVATMGRSSNAARIAPYRAHLHFELAMVINEYFGDWFQARKPDQSNDHGPWNGRNLMGLDPEALFKKQWRLGKAFSLLDYFKHQDIYFKLKVDSPSFPWLKRYAALIEPATGGDQSQPADVSSYELSFNAFGLPVAAKPLFGKNPEKSKLWEVSYVNEAIHKAFKCSKKIKPKGDGYQLTAAGDEWMDLLTFDVSR